MSVVDLSHLWNIQSTSFCYWPYLQLQIATLRCPPSLPCHQVKRMFSPELHCRKFPNSHPSPRSSRSSHQRQLATLWPGSRVIAAVRGCTSCGSTPWTRRTWSGPQTGRNLRGASGRHHHHPQVRSPNTFYALCKTSIWDQSGSSTRSFPIKGLLNKGQY